MGGPTKHQVLGALRPTVGNPVRLTTRFSGSCPLNVAAKVPLAVWGGVTNRLEIHNRFRGSVTVARTRSAISSGRVFVIHTRSRRILLHIWIALAIVNQHMVHIGGIHGPSES